jgi:predicted dehydrogenase
MAATFFAEGLVTMLRAGIVGCGAVTEIYHATAAQHCPQLTLAALVDADLGRARSLADGRGVALALDDYRELPGKIDVALIATSNTSHAEIACFLLERGIHVLCEKPLAPTADEARKMIAVAERHGTRLMAAHSRRFNPNLELCRELVAHGYVGELQTVVAALGGSYGSWPSHTDFRRQRGGGGGVLLDLGIHLIDLALSLGGGNADVASYEASDVLGWGVENDVDLLLDLAGGARARLSCSYVVGLQRIVRITGSAGWIETSVDGAPDVKFFSRRARLCQRVGAQRLLVPEADPYRRQIAHFVDAIVNDRPFAVPSEQVVAGLEIVHRCNEFARAA